MCSPKDLRTKTTESSILSERMKLVYCTKCGTKNEDDAIVCSNCKVSLREVTPKRYRSQGGCFGSSEGRHSEDECFGLPYGGAIAGIIFGLIIVIIGFAILSGLQVLDVLWPLMIVILGVLIIAGALYGMRRE